MKQPDLPKLAFIATLLTFLFGCGVLVGSLQSFPRDAIHFVAAAVAQVYEERHTLTGSEPSHFLQQARYEGDGVTRNSDPAAQDELVLLAGFFDNDNGLRLLRRDGSALAEWSVRFSEIFPDSAHMVFPPETDWNIDLHGALALPDGSVVFNFEYGGLVKLDRCGQVAWTLPAMTHHSVERAEGGGFWVPGRRLYSDGGVPSPFPPFEPPFFEDTLVKVSDDGRVLAELSVPALLYDNGLEAVVTASGHDFEAGMSWDREIVHLNKIEELTSDLAGDFPLFEAGDLMLSLRGLNMVLVVDPDDGKVKWWRTGPWLRQHDPEFRAGGRIVLFNNNNYRTAFDYDPEAGAGSPPRGSNIMELAPQDTARDLPTDTPEVIYGARADEPMISVIRGKVELTRRNGLLVTEFDGGRVFETDAEGRLTWEYINRYDAERIAEMTEARAYPADYFTVTDWSCPARGS